MPRRTINSYLTTLTRNQHLTNVQSQTKSDPCIVIHSNVFGLIVTVPDVLLLLWSETRTLVSDPYTHILSLELQPNHHLFVTGRIFERVGQIIVHHLSYSV